MIGNHTGYHHEQGHQHFKKAREQYPFLPLSETARGERALNHVLVSAPVKQIGQNHPREQRGKGCRIGWPTDRIEFMGLGR